ncbi:MAG: DUF2628 domain-containing protein [Proteobacteria bacterium]|nr:DUF2628 domain-containing protein [Pseudomonadota bacterium]
MNVYTVHLRRHGLDPDRDLLVVKEGFSWPAFFLSFLWALWHRLWVPAAVIFLAGAAIGLLGAKLHLDSLSQWALSLGLAAIVGYLGNDLRRRRLDRQGFALADVSSGDDADAALLRYLDSEPALAADLKP